MLYRECNNFRLIKESCIILGFSINDIQIVPPLGLCSPNCNSIPVVGTSFSHATCWHSDNHYLTCWHTTAGYSLDSYYRPSTEKCHKMIQIILQKLDHTLLKCIRKIKRSSRPRYWSKKDQNYIGIVITQDSIL